MAHALAAGVGAVLEWPAQPARTGLAADRLEAPAQLGDMAGGQPCRPGAVAGGHQDAQADAERQPARRHEVVVVTAKEPDGVASEIVADHP